MEVITNRGGQDSMNNDVRMRPDEAAQFIGCSEYIIRQMVRERRIPHYRIGVKILFSRQTLERWVAKQEAESIKPSA